MSARLGRHLLLDEPRPMDGNGSPGTMVEARKPENRTLCAGSVKDRRTAKGKRVGRSYCARTGRERKGKPGRANQKECPPRRWMAA